MPNKLSEDKQRISASLPKELVAAVQKRAFADGITFTDALREALAAFISQYESKCRKVSTNAKKKS